MGGEPSASHPAPSHPAPEPSETAALPLGAGKGPLYMFNARKAHDAYLAAQEPASEMVGRAPADASDTVHPSEIEANLTWVNEPCMRCGSRNDLDWKYVLCSASDCFCTADNAAIFCLDCIVEKEYPGFWTGMTRADIERADFDHRIMLQ